MKTRRAMLAIAVGLLFFEASCAESFYDLDQDSRMPKWFSTPSGLTRADVTVSMAYYVLPGKKTATFKLWNNRGGVMAKIDATIENESTGDDYPYYALMTANGVSEVIEYRQAGAIFYISDDPGIRKQLSKG
jgi:hypothetical protein